MFRDVVKQQQQQQQQQQQCSDKIVKGFKCQWTESRIELSYCL